ncbi:hypothetical protein ACFRCX_17470 [Streptomyces sp. NPDC056652]|uniref:hypothetical protein n=1 Tax=Streptomyces sp. NPDC056652 TaxID=3345893 RepID=UPI003690160D
MGPVDGADGVDGGGVGPGAAGGRPDGDLYRARFATATAVKASARRGCEAAKGGAVRSVPVVRGDSTSTASADGTCAGLPFGRDKRLDANARGQRAGARCPGHSGRALLTGIVPVGAATVWLPGEKGEETFGLPAFRECAERSAKRHGCTDPRLPPAG